MPLELLMAVLPVTKFYKETIQHPSASFESASSISLKPLRSQGKSLSSPILRWEFLILSFTLSAHLGSVDVSFTIALSRKTSTDPRCLA